MQLRNIEPAPGCACLRRPVPAQHGNGYFSLFSGPYLRKFLDGYYPMRVTLDVDYPAGALQLIDVSPAQQPGLNFDERPGNIRLDTLFEGELRLLLQFERR